MDAIILFVFGQIWVWKWIRVDNIQSIFTAIVEMAWVGERRGGGRGLPGGVGDDVR